MFKKAIYLSIALLLAGQPLAMGKKQGKAAVSEDYTEPVVSFEDFPAEILARILPALASQTTARGFLRSVMMCASINHTYRNFIKDYLPTLLKDVVETNRISIKDILSAGLLPDMILASLETFYKKEKHENEAKSMALILKDEIIERYFGNSDRQNWFYKVDTNDNHLSVNDKNTLVNLLKLGLISFVGDNEEQNALLKKQAHQLFMKAVEAGYADLVLILLSYGVDANTDNRNSQDKHDWTALMIASVKGYVDIVQLLIDAGAEINTENGNEATALIGAAEYGHANIVNILVKAGANLNRQNSTGKTALICAVLNSHIEAAKILIAAGADLNKKDSKGKTAVLLAKESNNSAMIALFEDESKKWRLFWQLLYNDISEGQWKNIEGLEELLNKIKDNPLIAGTSGDKQILAEIKRVLTQKQKDFVKAIVDNYIKEEKLTDFMS